MADSSNSETEKHVPMQQQADFQPITYSMGEDFPVKSAPLEVLAEFDRLFKQFGLPPYILLTKETAPIWFALHPGEKEETDGK
jgi:hypothetical protein